MARERRRVTLAVVFVALFAAIQALLWIAYYAYGAKSFVGDENNYQANAIAILHGGAWMPSSIWPPLQSLLIAAIYTISERLVAVQIVQTMLFFGCIALLRDFWRRIGASVPAANTAAALFALNPATGAYAHWLWPEMPHLFLLLAVFCLLARPLSRLGSFIAGACVGLAILAKSLLTPFWPLFLIALARRERSRLAIICAALFVCALGFVTTPALVHGWRAFGTPTIADSSIYNVWVGLTDNRRSDYVQDMGGVTMSAFLASGATPAERNAATLDKVRGLIADRGVANVLGAQLSRQYFRLFSAKTTLVSQLPGPTCAGHLSAYKSAPWLTRSLTGLSDLLHTLTLLTAAFGIACWPWRKPWRAAGATAAAPRAANQIVMQWLVALFLLYQIALFAVVHVKARFVLPMLPFLCGFGGSFLAGRTQLRLSVPRLALGALLAATLLFFAFAGPALDHLCAR